MNDFKEGERAFISSFDLHSPIITGIDEINGIKKYWLDGMFGYFHSSDLFKTKNEALDHLIMRIERLKDDK